VLKTTNPGQPASLTGLEDKRFNVSRDNNYHYYYISSAF